MSLFNRLLPNQQNQSLPGNTNTQKSNDFFFCLNIKQISPKLRKYFQIQEEQIKARVISAITLTPPFKQVVKQQPDLYGPFWISTTLVFIIVASASLVTFLAKQQNSEITYNFSKIPVAASLIYGISFGTPYLIAIMVKIFGGTISVVEAICVYGYSMAIFVPITTVCFIKIPFLQLGVLTVGFVLSAIFLIRGILSMDRSLGDRQKMVLGVFILGVQLILVLTYKLYFFDL